MLTSKSARKNVSYILLPAMIIYTVIPNYAYGANINITSSGTEASYAYYDNSQEKATYESARQLAEALNEKTSGKDKTPVKAGSDQQSQSSSMASNYTMGVDAEVNAMTGQLNLTFDNIKLSGMSQDVDVDLGISNGGRSTEDIRIACRVDFQPRLYRPGIASGPYKRAADLYDSPVVLQL